MNSALNARLSTGGLVAPGFDVVVRVTRTRVTHSRVVFVAVASPPPHLPTTEHLAIDARCVTTCWPRAESRASACAANSVFPRQDDVHSLMACKTDGTVLYTHHFELNCAILKHSRSANAQ